MHIIVVIRVEQDGRNVLWIGKVLLLVHCDIEKLSCVPFMEVRKAISGVQREL